MPCISDTSCRCLRGRPRPPLISTPKPLCTISPLCNKCQSIFDHCYDRNHCKTWRLDPLYHTISGLYRLYDSAHGGYHVYNLLFRGIAENNLLEILSKWRDEEAVVEVREWVDENGHFAVKLIWRFSLGQRAGYIEQAY
jgi:hypothetical protein